MMPRASGTWGGAIVALAMSLACATKPEPPAPAPRPPVVRLARDRAHVRIELPPRADQPFSLVDPRSGLSVRVRLDGARPAPARPAGASLRFPGALEHGELVLSPIETGVEDFVVLARPPASAAIRYVLELGDEVAGLRSLGGALELLDERGTPRLRMARPVAIAAGGASIPVAVALEGCAADVDPAPPWGRRVVAAGSARCVVRLSWRCSSGDYPLTIDPAWTTTDAMTAARQRHAAARLADGRVLVSGGYPSPNTSAELFDPSTESWALTGVMSIARYWHTATTLADGRVLVVGGYAVENGQGPDNGMNALGSAELYHPDLGSWSPAAELATERVKHAAALLLNGKVLVAGGTGKESAELYDPTANEWSLTLSMSVKRERHTATRLADGRVLVAGGYPSADCSEACASTELYDPATGAWQSAGDMSVGRWDHSATLLSNGEVLIAGGATDGAGTPTLTAERFNAVLAPDSWQLVAPMTSARFAHAAAGLASGVLVVGGLPGPSAGAELYEPASDTWMPLDPTGEPRARHTATTLGSGKVALVAGPGAGVEIYGIAPGAGACALAGECVSGYCTDGVCCDSPCAATCLACSTLKKGGGPDGVCGPIAQDTDPDGDCMDEFPSCGNNGLCDGDGACALYPDERGCAPTPCQSASECATGFCADGLCCAEACDEACVACSAEKKGEGADGICGPVPAGTDPDDRCEADADYPSSCRADGWCDGSGSCRESAVAGVSCGPPDCLGDARLLPVCSGAGVCVAEQQACAPARCEAGECRFDCRTDEDCGADAVCRDGTCRDGPVLGEPCAGDGACSTGQCVHGTCCEASDCGAYLCTGGACLGSCLSGADCAPGHRCSSSGTCVGEALAGGGGCSAAAPPRGSSWAALAVVVVAAASRLRRRCRCGVPRMLVVVLFVTTLGGTSHAQSTIEQAKRLFEIGNDHRRRGDCARALPYYERSRAIHVAAANLRNAAYCLHVIGRLGEALERSEELAALFGDELAPAERAALEADIAALRDRVGLIEVRGADGEVFVDDRRRATLPVDRPVAVEPGRHLVRVVRAARDPFELVIVVQPKGTVLLLIPDDDEPPAPPEPASDGHGWVEAVAAGSLASDWRSGADRSCGHFQCDGSVAAGALVGLRGGYPLAIGLDAEVALGFGYSARTLLRSLDGAFMDRQSGSTVPASYALRDEQELFLGFIGLGVGRRQPLGAGLELGAHVVVGPAVTAASDDIVAAAGAGGQVLDAELEGSASRVGPTLLTLPTLELGWRLGQWRVAAGLSAAFVLLEGPRYDTGDLVPVGGSCQSTSAQAIDCAPALGELAGERAHGPFALWLPGLSLGYVR